MIDHETVVIIVTIGIGLGIFWVYQFAQLMLLSDANFPGRYDKCLWVAAFCLACVLAPFAFLLWKRTHLLAPAPPAEPPHDN